MPSVDHVRVVRMLVKHVHSFVYAKGPDMSHFSNFHSTDELRRYVRVEFLGNHGNVSSLEDCCRLQGSLWREGLVWLLIPLGALGPLEVFQGSLRNHVKVIMEGLSCKIFN